MQTGYWLTLAAFMVLAGEASASATPARADAATCEALVRAPLDLAAETTDHIMAAEAVGGPAQASRSGTDKTRFIQSDFGPDWQAADFDFDRDPDRLREYEILYSASHPDLRAFRDAAGKLLIHQGRADARVAPLNSVDCYAAVTRAIGGSDETHSFARLVMVPGMEHCWDGDGPFAIDYIGAMEAWAERGQAPDRLDAAHRRPPEPGSPAPTFIHPFPAAAGAEANIRTLSTMVVR